MRVKYPAMFRDQQGEVETTIVNDGKILRMSLRGYECESSDWEEWEIREDTERFSLNRMAVIKTESGYRKAEPGETSSWIYTLTDFSLHSVIPLSVIYKGSDIICDLAISVNCANRLKPTFTFDLSIDDQNYKCATDFFDELYDRLLIKLSEDIVVKACVNCAYSACGGCSFGCLACFRGNKSGYRAVKHEGDLNDIWDTKTEWVQDTYLCPEFEQRQCGVYRGF